MARLRRQTRSQAQREGVRGESLRQKRFVGENRDLPASEIRNDQLAYCENVICYGGYAEARSGSQKFSDTSLPGSGTVYGFDYHKSAEKWLLCRGPGLYYADKTMSSWTQMAEMRSGTTLISIGVMTIREFESGFLIGTDNGIYFAQMDIATPTWFQVNADIPSVVPADSGSEGTSTPYGYRYVYTFVTLANTNGSPYTTGTDTRVGKTLVHESGTCQSLVGDSGSTDTNYYGERWVANPISSANTLSLPTTSFATSMEGHFTHIGVYRTLDIGENGIGSNGAGNNSAVYVWVHDVDRADIGTNFVDDIPDEELRQRYTAGYGLKTRFFQPLPNGQMIEATSAWLFSGSRLSNKVSYCQIASPETIGFYRPDLQFKKFSQECYGLWATGDILTILLANQTWNVSLNSFEQTSTLELVSVLFNWEAVTEKIGTVLPYTWAKLDETSIIGVCSDQTVRIFNGVRWSRDLSYDQIRDSIIRKIVPSQAYALGAYYNGGYYLWYRTAASGSSLDKCHYYGLGLKEGTGGEGWSEFTGTDWINPYFYVNPVVYNGDSGTPILMALDDGGSFYEIGSYDGYDSGPTRVDLDKVAVNGTGGTEIATDIKFKEQVGTEENFNVIHEETHFGFRPLLGDTGYRSGFEVDMKGWSDGAATVNETVDAVQYDGDCQFWEKLSGKRIQVGFATNRAAWRLVWKSTKIIVQDKADNTNAPWNTNAATYQTNLASNQVNWITRPDMSLDRVTGSSGTAAGTIADVTGPDGNDYAKSFTDGDYTFSASQSYAGDFSVFFWIKCASISSEKVISIAGTEFYLTFTNGTTLSVAGVGNVTVDDITDGEWHFFDVVRVSGTFSVYQNPASGASAKGTVVDATTYGGGNLQFGAISGGTLSMFDIRVYSDDLGVETAAYYYNDVSNNSGNLTGPIV